MISTITRIGLGLVLALWLAACAGSPPNSFYRLTPAAAAPTPGAEHPSLGVGPVDIPEFLNRSALVYSAGDNRLQIAGSERWAEPLEDGVKRVVGLNLALLLHSENLRYFPWDPRQVPDYGIRISVLDMDADARQATLVADWVLYRPGDGTTISRRISRFNEPLAAGDLAPAQLPPAYSALLYQLSETIAAAIRTDQQQLPGTPGSR